MLGPLFGALLFSSLIVKVGCWAISLLMYISFLRVQGPCVMALAVGSLPLSVFFEWDSSPDWLAYVAAAIAVIEISYIRHRMRIIAKIREKEDILL